MQFTIYVEALCWNKINETVAETLVCIVTIFDCGCQPNNLICVVVPIVTVGSVVVFSIADVLYICWCCCRVVGHTTFFVPVVVVPVVVGGDAASLKVFHCQTLARYIRDTSFSSVTCQNAIVLSSSYSSFHLEYLYSNHPYKHIAGQPYKFNQTLIKFAANCYLTK